MRIARSCRILLLAAAIALVACTPRTGAPAPAQDSGQAVADFYNGNTLTVIVSDPPGGANDATARVLARHIGNHIPGNPDVIVENMPGAAGLVGANHLYNAAEPDGLTIGTFGANQIVSQATGGDGIQFEARNFGWLGTVQRVSTACTIRADSP